MSAIFTTPYLKLVKDEDSWRHQYRDHHGTVLGNVVQVVGTEPPRGFFSQFRGNSHNLGRIVLRVDGPAGPLFFIDRAEVPAATVVQPPSAVVAPDGRVIGRVVHDAAGFAQSYLAGMRDPAVHGREAGRLRQVTQQSYQLMDGHDRPLGTVTWEEVKLYAVATEHGFSSRGGSYCDYTDANGVAIGRYETAGDLRINHQTPQPLRALAVAAPIAMQLMSAATFM